MAIDVLGNDCLENLVDLIKDSIQPQVVDLIMDKIDATPGVSINEPTEEIDLYIYYESHDEYVEGDLPVLYVDVAGVTEVNEAGQNYIPFEADDVKEELGTEIIAGMTDIIEEDCNGLGEDDNLADIVVPNDDALDEILENIDWDDEDTECDDYVISD